VDRYLTDPPLSLPPAVPVGEFDAAELIFYDVDHSGPSFAALVFLNSPDADIGTPLDDEAGFAGSFYIFGHGGCVGDEGHCEVPDKPKDPFDTRPLHPLTRQTKIVDISAALKRADVSSGELLVTVVPVVPAPEQVERADVLFFSAMRFVTYNQVLTGGGEREHGERADHDAPYGYGSYWDSQAVAADAPTA
jgi:hypothetical protein